MNVSIGLRVIQSFLLRSLPFQSVLIGCCLAGLSCILSNFLQGATSYSNDFISSSLNPFSTHSDMMQYRLLIPLLGYITGLKGQYYYILSLLGNVLFLIMTSYWALKFYQSKLTAFLLASCMAALPVVLLNDSYYGWSDVFCYALLLMALLSPRYCPLIIFMGLTTHEFFFAYIPFIFLYHYRFHPHFFEDKRKLIKIILGLLAALLIYSLIRSWITSRLTPQLTTTFYLSSIKDNGPFYQLTLPPLLAGLISAYKMSLILFIPFLYFVLRYIRSKTLDVLVLVSTLLPLLLLILAHDVTRLISNTFIFILLFPKYIPHMRNGLLTFILLGNLLIPSFCFDPYSRLALDKQAVGILKKVNSHQGGYDAFGKYLHDFDIKALIKLCSS